MPNKSEKPRPPWDHNFAVNFKRFREDKGITQEQVVEQMAEFGFSFHQATVYKIEKGERKVALGEALALSSILGITVENMTDQGPLATGYYYESDLNESAREMLDRLVTIWDLTDEYNEYRSKLIATLSRFLNHDNGQNELERVFPDKVAVWMQRVRTVYVPVFKSQAINKIRDLVEDETTGLVSHAFADLIGYESVKDLHEKPADAILKAADRDQKKLIARWGL